MFKMVDSLLSEAEETSVVVEDLSWVVCVKFYEDCSTQVLFSHSLLWEIVKITTSNFATKWLLCCRSYGHPIIVLQLRL